MIAETAPVELPGMEKMLIALTRMCWVSMKVKSPSVLQGTLENVLRTGNVFQIRPEVEIPASQVAGRSDCSANEEECFHFQYWMKDCGQSLRP